MNWMDSRRSLRGLSEWLMAAMLVCGFGCSRQIAVPAEEGSAQTDPGSFREIEANPQSEPSATVTEGSSGKESGLPFHDSQDLPTGTLLTIQLEAPIVAENMESFEGIIDDPVMVRGKIVIPRGTPVAGRVEFASSSTVTPARAYVRLALTSIHVSGTDLSVRTASLFARQHNPNDPSNPIVWLDKGHRLTFRLTEPFYASTQTAQVTR
jgi:hypothetical protein